MSIRGGVILVASLLGMFLTKYLADRFQMPEVKPWGQWASDDFAAEG